MELALQGMERLISCPVCQAVERYGGDMEEKDCWDKFAVSGKVEDYLKYRNSVGDAAHNKADSTQAAEARQETEVYRNTGGTASCSGKSTC
ncbi:MAG: hypothetical protein K1W15_15145 [Lachnospiraceae bacterium]|jgi:hypothetical protein